MATKTFEEKRKEEPVEDLDAKVKAFDDRISGLQKARQQQIDQAKKERVRLAIQAKKNFQSVSGAFQSKGVTEKVGKKGRITRPSTGKGFVRLKPLKPINSTGWSDLGLVAGTPFKNYESKSILPRSTPDRSLHPQEKAELAVTLARRKLFGFKILE